MNTAVEGLLLGIFLSLPGGSDAAERAATPVGGEARGGFVGLLCVEEAVVHLRVCFVCL